MLNFLKTSLAILISLISVLSIISCSAAKQSTAAAKSRTVTVTRGDLAINVSVDGNLNMPNEYDLRFGAPGQVRDIYVQDGDTVKAGEILATLDDKTERQGLETASNNLQQTLSSLYETIPLTPQVSGYVYAPITNGALPGNSPYILQPPEYYPFPNTSGGSYALQPPSSVNSRYAPPPIYVDGSGNVVSGYNLESDPTLTQTQAAVPTTPNPPTYFAYQSAAQALSWAQNEIYSSYIFAGADNITVANSQLNMAGADLESCAQILQDAVNNTQSGMGNTAQFLSDNNTWSFLLQNPQNGATSNILDVRRTIDLLRQREADIQQIQSSISDNNTAAAVPLFQDLFNNFQSTSSAVYSDVNFIKVYYTYPFPYQDISHYFYGKAQDSLTNVLNTAQTGQFNTIPFYENLTMARHYIQLTNSFLGSNEIDLQHGLSQPNEQNFKVNLSKSAVSLENANIALLNSIIIAPVDGIVVNVGIKANDVLSNQDYSSRTAVMLVDTSDIEFKGLVDEIDITKVKTGQKVNISVDAVPNRTFTGVVSFISPYGTTQGNVVKYNVTVLLDPTDVALKGGLSATADIVVDSLKNVLLVPISTVITTSSGSSVMWVNPKTGVAEERKVTVGQQNLQYAQITSGLSEGDQLSTTVKTSSAVVTGFPSPGQQSTQQSSSGGGGGR